jgi:hypothetical protein
MEKESTRNPFADCEVISSYSRADALEDGVLVDVSELAKEAGFIYPVAVTRAVYDGILNPSPELERQGQSFAGRAWDMLTILRVAIRTTREPGDQVRFAPLFIRKPGGSPEPVALRSVVGPGDAAEPVITILLPSED